MKGKRPYKRRRFFVKQWFQLRYMALFAGSTVLGGLVFGFCVKGVVRRKISLEMFRPHSDIQSLWEILYPDVMRMTLVLFVFGVVVLLALLRVFGGRVNRAAWELETYIGSVIGSSRTAGGCGSISVPEFREFGEEVESLVTAYRQRWDNIAREAEAALALGDKAVEASKGTAGTGEVAAFLEKADSIAAQIRHEAKSGAP